MSSVGALCDLGSTYTKVAFVDLQNGELVSWAKSPTTVETDITEGLSLALNEAATSGEVSLSSVSFRKACSSAGGGLGIVAVGLVPDLTGEAAKRAALGAGAKVLETYSYELTDDDIDSIEELAPDIILLCGGTDGGETTTIIGNARVLANSQCPAPILVAGNRTVAGEVRMILESAGKICYVTENVLPALDYLNVDPVRGVIRSIFLQQIVVARGLDRAEELIGEVVMPTPRAVLGALEAWAGLRSIGDSRKGGFIDVRRPTLAVDVGGATTDVYSVGRGLPSSDAIVKGMPEPISKRTVEGDLGVRYSAETLVDAMRAEDYLGLLGGGLGTKNPISLKHIERYLRSLREHPATLPASETEKEVDVLLASYAAATSLKRHAGRLDVEYTAAGRVNLIRGKDLRAFRSVIGTGGPIISGDGGRILAHANQVAAKFGALVPESPAVWVDQDYVLFAAGLLAEEHAEIAKMLLEKSLMQVSLG